MADLRPLKVWTGAPATFTLWQPTQTSLELAHVAPISEVPPSYEQAQHLRSFRACQNQNEEMARLLVFVWEEPGQCKLDLMASLVVAHVRRHDTYHSRFEERGDDIVRRVIAQPDLIEMSTQTLEHASAQEWQQLIAGTPGPFNWDCFRS